MKRGFVTPAIALDRSTPLDVTNFPQDIQESNCGPCTSHDRWVFLFQRRCVFLKPHSYSSQRKFCSKCRPFAKEGIPRQVQCCATKLPSMQQRLDHLAISTIRTFGDEDKKNVFSRRACLIAQHSSPRVNTPAE